MSILWVIQDTSFQTFPVTGSEITIGGRPSFSIPVAGGAFPDDGLQLKKIGKNDGFDVYENRKMIGSVTYKSGFDYKGNKLRLLLTGEPEESFYYAGPYEEILFSQAAEGVVRKKHGGAFQDSAPFLLYKFEGRWRVQPKTESGAFYLNGKKRTGDTAFENGDMIFWSGLLISLVQGDLLKIESP